MSTAFIIIQIGDPQLDSVCANAIVPALKACGLDPKRVDKHNKGGLLKSEIIGFIESADIIIADLTNERPNCYLEVGYTMGIDKFSNLVLTARDDHNQNSPSYKHRGPKVHFDLSGYDILFWDPNHLDIFRDELEKRIRRRLAVLSPTSTSSPQPWDNDWIDQHQKKGFEGLQAAQETATPGFMEIGFALSGEKPNFTQRNLLEAAREAQINTFGWPIGVVFVNREEYRPRSTADGIVAEVSANGHGSYDYWALRRNGDFYLIKSLFEDRERTGVVFFNTRIVRVTETLLYCARLYSRLNIPGTSGINISVVHGGLKDRVLASAGGVRELFQRHSTTENQVGLAVSVQLSSIESDLVQLVKELVSPLFMVFDFFELSDHDYADIVNQFVQGRTS
ncbi:MAG: hypothetical protein IH977_12950 [Nitrospinae bacterium]|nr:hypothetical protein [Nitrospinota bacterium]